MPVLIIGGDGPKEEKASMPKMAPRKGGIGGKYSADSESMDSETATSPQETDARKREAGKLLLRAIKNEDPNMIAEAITTLVDCCSEEEGVDLGETE